MAKIQARNVDDALYQRIEQSAMKNERSLEGEIRMALATAYPPPGQDKPVLSGRERWQRETGRRLSWLLDRLTEDNYFHMSGYGNKAGLSEIIRLARQVNTSPGLLMDIMQGRQELTIELADATAACLDADASWLLGGREPPFPTVNLGMDYHDFFRPTGDDARYVFEFIRISKGRHDGTLLCLRIHPETGHMKQGAVTAEFKLCKDGSGGTGHGKLLGFMLFLKTHCADRAMNSFDWTPADLDFDFWSVVGQHHPVWFQNFRYRNTAGWLQQLFSGQDPDGWFRGWEADLEKIRDTPFGGRESRGADAVPAARMGSK
ncbi:hypothetical protein AB6T85_21820 [Erwinia sp. ACCC 02193]|uniref:Antitoxin FitA-like ribbon-helix-helix domain-containing protein n=1 Tax=Erwinia aeris TaxID=3239803 RepID=A0ABV4EDN8_9GAMM